ncbi:MAG: alkaline phosphatase [Verrucomicrobia bacterium]|nr:alkaline phosphatase [Verrucomicrobiota bacterium]
MRSAPCFRRLVVSFAVLAVTAAALPGAPRVTRLTPPSGLFSFGDPQPPIIARFLPGQRFDLQATIAPDAGQIVVGVKFYVDDADVPGPITIVRATVAGLPANTYVARLRAYSNLKPGIHRLIISATQLPDGQSVIATGNFEIVPMPATDLPKAKNIIIMIGDGMGIAHRTATRIVLNGISQGKALAPLVMDTFPVTGLVQTCSLSAIVTDSSPGASCYSTGNKNDNNEEGVFPDDTTDAFDNPRMEYMGEFLARTQGKSLGIVTTSDVADATPAAQAIHTQNRSNGTGICDQYLDEAVARSNLTVLLGGGRKWFLPAATAGSARTNATDYVLPAELAAAWGVPAGALDPNRDLLADFQRAGFAYTANATQLKALPDTATKLLGLFTLGHMNVASDKIDGRRGSPAIVNDYGFPDQPMLDEMIVAALPVLAKNPAGFVLMVEGASIDKQSHNMDTERWILETIEFDRAVARAKAFAAANPDTLVLVTADHECGGVNIIGASRVTQASLNARAFAGGGAAQLRDPVVGTYENAGFPLYGIMPDGYPATTNPDRKLLVGYAANADRYEDWQSNPRPLRDSGQPFNNTAPLNTYPATAAQRRTNGNFFIAGQVPGNTAVHTASDVPLSAYGRGAALFTGTMDNTDVFFRAMKAILAGADNTVAER